eukprot:209058-Pelagomonas_calceolata.AAC.4
MDNGTICVILPDPGVLLSFACSRDCFTKELEQRHTTACRIITESCRQMLSWGCMDKGSAGFLPHRACRSPIIQEKDPPHQGECHLVDGALFIVS